MNKGFLKGMLSVSIVSSIISGVIFHNALTSRADGINYINSSTSMINENKITGIDNFNIYFGQLHSHSDFSDGQGTCEEAYIHASTQAIQLDFFAVTDHSQCFDNQGQCNINDASLSQEWQEGKRLAQKYTTDKFIALYGYEMTWGNGLGHINTLNTTGFESAKLDAYLDKETALQNYYKTLQSCPDSINVFNHPSTKWGYFNDFGYYDVNTDNVMHLLELTGYGSTTQSIDEHCKFYNRALDKGWHVSPANNQDNHKKEWGTQNPRRTVILAKSLSESNIYDAIKNNRTYATEDYDFQLKYTLNDYLLGSKINVKNVGDTAKIKIKVYDPSDANIGKIDVIANQGKVLATADVKGNSNLIEIDVPTTYSYYYVRILQEDGDRIVSAPIWLGNYKTTDAGAEPTIKPAVNTQPTNNNSTENVTTNSTTNNNNNNNNNTNNNTTTTNNNTNNTTANNNTTNNNNQTVQSATPTVQESNTSNVTTTPSDSTTVSQTTETKEITEEVYNGTQVTMDPGVVVPDLPETSTLDDSPKTGDEQNIYLWFMIMTISLVMTLIGGISLRKNNQ